MVSLSKIQDLIDRRIGSVHGMRWEGRRESENVEDRRGQRSVMRTGAGLGCLGTILVLVVAMLTGADPGQLMGVFGGGEPQVTTAPGPDLAGTQQDDEMGRFMRVVLADNEETWSHIFQEEGVGQFRPPGLVLYEDATSAACGMAQAAAGPFYCALDHKIYLDTAFFRELDRRFGAAGDFAQAYVVAHEVAHGIQNQLGTLEAVNQQRARLPKLQANQLSIRLELQADCFAGVWGRYAQEKGMLERGDAEEGLRAAAAVGDDNIQRQTQGYVVPEAFNHGTSQQRMEWFAKGFDSGDSRVCDTLLAG